MSLISDLPAILGGAAVRPQGPPVWPLPDDGVWQALQSAFGDGSWGRYQGGRCEHLAQVLAEVHGVPQVTLCGSGTYAVELALWSLQIGAGDEVLLAAYDYPGNFLGVHAVGAMPVLVDLDPDNWNLDVALLDGAAGPATKAVLASHLHGGVVPMRELTEWARGRGVAVIEDAAQCPGAIVQGRRAGTWGDLGVLSFGGSKLLSAGRGGALLAARADLHQRARNQQLRGNIVCPLSELQAAVLLPQLELLDERNQTRAANVNRLTESLNEVPGIKPFVNRAEAQPGYYKLGLRYDAEAFGLPRAVFVQALRAEGIAVDEGFAALHVGRSPKRYRAAGPLIQAERAHTGAVVLHHPILLGNAADMEEIGQAVAKIRTHRARLANAEGFGNVASS